MVKSKEDLGEPLPYDPDFNGPLKNRSCTDVLCLLLFMVFVACWVGIGIYAFTNGDPNALLVPKDSVGRRCGMDADVRDRPYLFFFDLTRCLDPAVPFTGCPTTQVCVKQCPSENYFSDGSPPVNRDYCSIDNEDECPAWYLKSTVFQKRCVPNLSDITNATINNIEQVTNSEFSLDKIKKSISNIKLFAQAEEIGQNIVEDIMQSWINILIGVGFALVACIIYILLLRWIAAVMVWLSVIGVLVILGAGVYFSTIKYIEFKDAYNSTEYEEVKAQIKTKRDLWLAGLIIFSVVLVVILLVLIFLRKRIQLAIALVKEGSRAVSSVTASLFFPIFPWLLQIGVIGFAIAVALFLTSTGEPVYKTRYIPKACNIGYLDNIDCNPEEFANRLGNLTATEKAACANSTCKFIKMENDAFYPYLQTINVFGFFWLVFFVSALAQMVLASVFAQWYWTFNKRNLPFFAVTEAFCRTARYHIGTLAFGSLIIAICRMIRVLLEYIDQKIKAHPNELTRAILCCCKCFFWCLEKFLKFINKNAYIMCAVHGKNFCASAKDAFMLLMRNIIRVFVLDKVTDFLFFLSKLLVTMGVGAVAYIFIATDLIWSDYSATLNYPVVPVVIIMICTYLISSVFFGVYSMAVDTLFLCFLEDCERNDGSAEKPYFMSTNLMKIFGKKNKRE